MSRHGYRQLMYHAHRLTKIATLASVTVVAAIGVFELSARPLLAQGFSFDQPSSDGDSVDAVTEARHDLRLGFSVRGTMEKVFCTVGQSVKAGDVLMELDHDDIKAQIKSLRKQADSQVALQQAQAQRDQADLEFKRLKSLDTGASPYEVERARLNVTLTSLAMDEATEQQELLALELERLQEMAGRYVLKAPRDGVVDQIIANEGETVEDVNPILRLVDPTVMQVDVMVDTWRTLKLKVGQRAFIQPKIEGMDPIEGKIQHIVVVAEAMSRTRTVRVYFENDEKLPAGVHVLVRFDTQDAVAMAEPAND